MISKAQVKNLRALRRKKARHAQGLFLVEGEKVVAELLDSNWTIERVFATDTFLEAYGAQLDAKQQDGLRDDHLRHNDLQRSNTAFPVVECSAESLSAVSTLVTNNAALAVVRCKETSADVEEIHAHRTAGGWTLALDDVNDPGNFGSLLRIADWYGIRDIVCSPQTVDLYNPKVISASKGSFLRVNVHHVPLDTFFDACPPNTPVLGALLDGESVHTLTPIAAGGIILMGSEAHGIAPAHQKHITRHITIPSYGHAESLNVSIAAAIICDNIARIHGD